MKSLELDKTQFVFLFDKLKNAGRVFIKWSHSE